jgi:hypothetical protein
MWLVLILALLGFCVQGADLFPLQQGSSWTYREKSTGGTFTVEVGAAVTLNDKTYFPLTGYVPQQVLVRLDDQKRLVYADPDSGQEATLTYFTPPSGSGWWDAPLRTCAEQAQVLQKRGTHDGTMGVVTGVIELQYRSRTCADSGDLSEQYAANIGMVRRVTQSIAGPRQYDLIHAKVGGIVIDALPYARFSVSIDDRPNTASVMATLRLQSDSETPLKLEFASGQEYDLVLTSSDGKVVWKWSTDQMFIQSLHERTVVGEWSTTVTVPRPGPGTYTLQAWLTTIGNPAQFAATVPVTIGQ